MKMLLNAAGLALSASLIGCANAPVKLIPPQQLVTAFCPVVNADLDVLSKSPLLDAAQQETLANVLSVNQSVCAADAKIDVTDLQKLNATAFPALIGLVGALPMLPNQPAILLGLTLAQPILAQVTAQLAAAAPTSASSHK